MKTSTFGTIAFLLLAFSAGAQKFTVLPQFGLENPLTRLSLNERPSFTPLASQLNPAIGVRLDYQLKKGFGPYVGVSTSRSTVDYNFTNIAGTLGNFNAIQGNTQLQLQGGLQARSKPIFLKKNATATQAPVAQEVKSSYSRCGRYQAPSRCGSQSKQQQAVAPAKSKGMFVSVIPSVGVAMNPFTPDNVNNKFQSNGSTATYRAGNVNTALVTGIGFEFANSTKKLFAVNVNYFRGLGSNPETITTESGLKTVTTNLSSAVSGWNATFGIPISLGKKPAIKQPEKKTYQYNPYKSCSRGHCRREI